MKVISLVPSWTEMLIECGVNIVGRTRFCVHPKDPVKSIAVVGGTKDLNWEKIKALNADLLILDQEENLPWMKEDSPIPVLVTHVTSVASVAAEIEKMSQILTEHSHQLQKIADRWSQIANCSKAWDWKHIPGEMECLQRQHSDYGRLIYVIWKNPWMRVSRPSFIASVLETLGAGSLLVDDQKKYPEFQLSDFNLETTYFLFSSEPFPFHRKKKDLLELGIQGSIVDGECYSWFGLRSLLFLEKTIGERYTDPDKSKSSNC